jgi:hypothetical protein
MGLDGLDRDLHQSRDLVVFETVHIAKHATSAHLLRKPRKGGAQGVGLLALHGFLQGIEER